MLIQSEIGQQYFEEHLKKEFSDENLYFYCEVVNLKCAKEKEVEQLIKSIFTDYISPNGSTPVNIDTTIVKHVKQELKANKSRHIFDTALDHIYTLMRKDSYKRFLTSPIYKEALNNAKHPCKPRKEKGGLPEFGDFPSSCRRKSQKILGTQRRVTVDVQQTIRFELVFISSKSERRFISLFLFISYDYKMLLKSNVEGKHNKPLDEIKHHYNNGKIV
uniref:RGS domain-containing protein n=1 Tax=Ciona savignyi TaxID=51511 RepID=H2Z1U2_CIOSA